jgi:hypothetical protein
MGKCPKGTRKNRRTGECEPKRARMNCPKGFRKHRPSGKCIKRVIKSPSKRRCDNGTRRNPINRKCEVYGNCEPYIKELRALQK